MRQIYLHFVFLFLIVFTFNGYCLSQQIPQYTQWASHQFALNPAHAGIKSCLDAHSLYRMQWLGFDGAPKSGFVTMTIPLNFQRKYLLSARHGVGGKIEMDNIGQFSSTRLNLAYASHFNFTPETRLSLGIYAGFIQLAYNAQNQTTILPDPTVLKTTSFISPDASFGAWWNGKNYYFGLVMQNLMHAKWETIGSDSHFRIHTNLNGGYRMPLNKTITMLPGFLLKIPPAGPIALDLNLLFDYNGTIGLGLGYRNTDAFMFLANFKIKQKLSIQYSYDFVTSPLRKGTVNSHELSISYTTCKPKNTKGTVCALFE